MSQSIESMVNTLRPRQNGRHFADDIFKRIFFNENVWIPIQISLKFVPKGPINNIPALDRIMAWPRPGDKPLSEPMMARLPTHICVTRPQWVNCSQNIHITVTSQWAPWCLKSPASWLFAQPRTHQRKHQSSMSLAFVSHRWIPLRKSQLCGISFHLAMSSWCKIAHPQKSYEMALKVEIHIHTSAQICRLLTHWPLGDVVLILKMCFSYLCYTLI